MLWSVALGLAAVAAMVFGYAVLHRLPYPHDLEWMEGALVDHAARVANGLPLYCAPGPEHVPFLYAPLLFWLGGIGMALGGDGLLTLRLIATVASVGTAMLIGHWVRRETGQLVPALVATGLFLAGYGWLAFWYDLARNDSLFVLLCLSAAYLLRHGGPRRWLAAAACATAACFAKQSALMWLPAIAVGTACLDWRMALRFAGATALGVFVGLSWMHLASGGWSTFWLFEMPRHHGRVGTMWIDYWTICVPILIPLLALGVSGFVASCREGHVRRALFLAAVGSGGLLASWLSRVHVGGFDNVMMYAFAGACLLGPIAAAASGRLASTIGPALLLVQFVLLGHAAWQRDPLRSMLPEPAHRRAHEQLLEFVRSRPGAVWLPGHGGLGIRTQRGAGAHGQAIFDLLQLLPLLPDGMLDLSALTDRTKLDHLPPRAQEAVCGFFDASVAALRERRFAAVVVDETGTGVFPLLFATGLTDWVRVPDPLLTEPTALRPLVGYDVHSPYALVPR